MAVALQPLGGVLWDFAKVRPMVLRALSCRSDPRRRSIGILAALGFDLYQSADYAMRSQRVFEACRGVVAGAVRLVGRAAI